MFFIQYQYLEKTETFPYMSKTFREALFNAKTNINHFLTFYSFDIFEIDIEKQTVYCVLNSKEPERTVC